jgi:hypothetical protein
MIIAYFFIGALIAAMTAKIAVAKNFNSNSFID